MQTGVDGGTWLVMLITAPLAAAVLAFVWSSLGSGMTLLVGMLINVAALAVCRLTLDQGRWEYVIGGWATPLGISWQVDGLSAFMVLMTALIALSGGSYGLGYFVSGDGEEEGVGQHRRFFWPLWLFLWAALNALFLSADLFNIYVTLEFMTVAAVALIALTGKGQALRAAMRYLLAALLGSMIYLLGVALLYGNYGVLELAETGRLLESNLSTMLAATLITIGLLLKAAVFPLHFWLPGAHSKAPAPVSAVLSAVVVAASFYLLVRLWFGPFAVLLNLATAYLLGGLGAAAIFWGGIQALRQRRLKMLIAYSTVSQLGYGMLVFPLVRLGAAPELAWSGALLVVFAHGLAKAALFFAAGCMVRHFGHDRIDRLAGASGSLVWVWLAFALATASLIGLPPSGGFAGKWLLMQAAFAAGAWGWGVVIVGGTLLATAYLFKVLGRALHPGPSADRAVPLPFSMLIMAFLPALGAFVLGLFVLPLRELLGVGMAVGLS